jgi:hypothetical protein
MNADKFVELIGFTDSDGALVEAVQAQRRDLTGLTPQSFREYGNAYVRFPAQGMELVFVPRSMFEEERGNPKGNGKYVLEAVFLFPNGGDDEPYAGSAPFAIASIKTRADALAFYGEPVDSEETDGVAESDDWLKGELQVSCAYDDDQSIANICVMPPYKG